MEPGPYAIQDDLALKLSEDGKFLQAEFPTALNRRSINLDWFQQQLSQHGLDVFRLNKDAIANCIREYNAGTNASTINIAEVLDGEFHIKLDKDLMSAHLSVSRAYGGTPVTKDMILETVRELGITTGLQETQIDAALQTGDAQEDIRHLNK